MTFFLFLLIFVFSVFLLTISSRWLVEALSRIAFFLKIREFVLGYFLMASAVSLPNLFVGIVSALNKIPQLSFADIVGGNIFDLTVVIGLAALISRGGLTVQSRTVQGSAIFTIFAALLPLFLIFDGYLSRVDALLLILIFFFYTYWLFSKKERFTKIYEPIEGSLNFKRFFLDLFLVFFGIVLLLTGAKGLVDSVQFFSQALNIPLVLIGILLVGAGNCLPELFFSLQAARKGEDWLLLGDLMGGVAITATLVLGVVAFIQPIEISDFSPFFIARAFLVISALSFLFFLRSESKITKREGIFLLSIYFFFLVFEILFK